MKNLKRIIALVAVFAMVLTTVSFAATYTDIPADSDYYEAVETLSKLEIVEGYEDGEFKAEQNVTRAEMTALIARLLGIGETAANKIPTEFADVPEAHWASGYVAWANSSNVVKGYGDGNFGPDNNVLYEEAVTMIMRALGYELVAAGKGGYPAGFIASAIQSGVTTDVNNAVQGTYANRGTIAQLLGNAIDTPLVDQYKWNTDGTGEFIKYDGVGEDYRTIMSEYLGVAKIKGVVVDTPFTADADYPYDIDDVEKVSIVVTDTFSSPSKVVRGWTLESKVVNEGFVNEDEVEDVNLNEYIHLVEPTVFDIAGTDAADYFERSVLAYVRENKNDDWEIISIVPDASRMKEITFSVEALADAIDEEDEEKIRYYKNGEDKKSDAKLAEGFMIFVNGEEDENGIFPADFENKNGSITLVDHAKSAGYETILVELVETDVVEEVTTRNITFKGETPSVKYTDDDTKIIVKKDGEIIDAADLEEDDVVAITRADRLVVVEVLTETIEGKITGTKSSEDSKSGYAYRINGEYYGVAACMSDDNCDKLKTGYEGTFYLDKFGEIVYFVGNANLGKLAYVLDVSDLGDKDKWGKTDIEVMLLTVDGVKTYKVADAIRFNGAYTDEDPVEDGVSYTLEDNLELVHDMICSLQNAVIKFALVNDKISKIYTECEDNYFEYVKGLTDEWSAEDKAFGNKEIDENAIVFSIGQKLKTVKDEDGDIVYEEDGETPVKELVNDADESFVTTIADFVDTDEYRVILYATADTDADADIVVTKDLQLDIADKGEFAIITDIEETENEDEEEIFGLTIMYNGEIETYNTTARVFDEYEGDLAIGDVVKVKINGEDVITNLTKAEFNVARYDVDAEAFDDVITKLYAPEFNIHDEPIGDELEDGKLSSIDPETGLPVDAEFVVAGYTYYKSGDKVHVLFEDIKGNEALTVIKFNKARRIYLVEASGRKLDQIKVEEATASDILWDKELTEEVEGGDYDGKNVADITKEVENEAGDEFEAAEVFTQIYATFSDEGDVDMIFLVAGQTDYDDVL